MSRTYRVTVRAEWIYPIVANSTAEAENEAIEMARSDDYPDDMSSTAEEDEPSG